ncbi:MAG: 2-phospho-L-lactate guanylyltransferase [Blastocatellia bacterium]|nr:2-phospho-L-lactate guanylyltransferase [Blastocatellia bacterium]MCS7158459.1 2-phospho-L-lactate guanylyltransferase [Blastocatellia bacterium]MCX7753469.1 2-phospho-L-lactate guanylyltransferase [Blastocatellia bacterium]MDW8167860.1 2-phospho-L-lactate guanylyltransferase [Acidobacteriota bacterium]
MIWAVVPVKDFQTAKQRLHAVLAPGERRALARAMLEDVLGALVRVHELDRLVLVTREPHAVALARRFGAFVLSESSNRGQTAAVERALAEAHRQGASAVLALPSDVPLIAPADVEAILRAGERADVVLVPSRDGRGTNAMWLRLPTKLPLRFGEDSFHFHYHKAHEAALCTVVLDLPRVALDVDAPEDLGELARQYETTPELAVRSATAVLFEERQWLARFR